MQRKITICILILFLLLILQGISFLLWGYMFLTPDKLITSILLISITYFSYCFLIKKKDIELSLILSRLFEFIGLFLIMLLTGWSLLFTPFYGFFISGLSVGLGGIVSLPLNFALLVTPVLYLFYFFYFKRDIPSRKVMTFLGLLLSMIAAYFLI